MERGEGIVRWSPHASRDDFLTVDFGHRIIQRYRATGKATPAQFDYEQVSRYVDHPAVTAYDWSPKIEGLVALGTKSGEVHLVRIDDDSNDSMILPLKLQRACQAVSFNNEGLLAVGLDRVRNDQCLQIWDINQRLQKWDPSKKGWQYQHSSGPDPVYKLEPSVAVTSARFFLDQPQTLVVGIKNSSVRIHDLRDPHGAVITFQTRCNNNLAIDNADPNYFASSSLDQPSVMVWDRRASSRQSCSKPYLEAVDGGEVPWGCALRLNSVINPKKDSYIRSLRFCRDRPGLLGVLSSSGEMQLLHLEKEFAEDSLERNLESTPEFLELRKSHDVQYPYFDGQFGYSYEDRIISFDWIPLRSEIAQPRIVTRRSNQNLNVILYPSTSQKVKLDLVNFSGGAQYHEAGRLPRFEDKIEESKVLGAILTTHSQKDTGFGSDRSTGQTSDSSMQPSTEHSATKKLLLKHASEINEHLGLSQPARLSQVVAKVVAESGDGADADSLQMEDLSLTGKRLSSREQHEKQLATAKTSVKKGEVSMMIKTMISRIKKGYLFDCAKNQEIVNDDPWLQDLWTWVEGAEEACQESGMISGPLNLAYMGVLAIWSNDLGNNYKSRLTREDNTIHPSAMDWNRALEDINRRAGSGNFEGVKTEKPQHRQLGLAICGWGKSSNELETELKDMEAQHEYTKAAAWALFEKDHKRAVQILKRGGKELLFVAMALDLHSKGASSLEKTDWEHALHETPEMAHDPYLCAIYALISTGDWLAIADEESLPLRERIAVALRNFTDQQLNEWFSKQLRLAIETGDIEAIVLTGITDGLVDIFSKYISKFGDYQTATLVMSFGAPLYVEDIRFMQWRETYQELHNVNKFFIPRCRFDVQSTIKSRRGDGTTVIKPNPRQVTLRCVHCDTAYTHDLSNTASGRNNESNAPSTSSRISLMERNPLYPTGVNAGICCPKCGRHLPRCAVCLMTLGMPRADRPKLGTDKVDQLASFLTFCLKCDHACHADHSRDWFKIHNECPVPECHCRCSESEGGVRRAGKEAHIDQAVHLPGESEE